MHDSWPLNALGELEVKWDILHGISEDWSSLDWDHFLLTSSIWLIILMPDDDYRMLTLTEEIWEYLNSSRCFTVRNEYLPSSGLTTELGNCGLEVIPIQTSSFNFLISRHFLLIKWGTAYLGFEVAVAGCAFSKAAAEPPATLYPGPWAPCSLLLTGGAPSGSCPPISALFQVPPSSLLVLWRTLPISHFIILLRDDVLYGKNTMEPLHWVILGTMLYRDFRAILPSHHERTLSSLAHVSIVTRAEHRVEGFSCASKLSLLKSVGSA